MNTLFLRTILFCRVVSPRLVAARATRLVHVGEQGRARAALERDSALGQIRPADVEERGVHGEVVRASVGSVAAEMLDKHPAASPLDAELGAASADDLLRAAAAGTAGAGLRAADLTRMVEELFADLPRFTRYVQRLSRLSMPGADLIRFEHVQALVRSGHAAVLRSFVLSVAQGRVPAEARPYVYGGRLVAPAKPGGGAHWPLVAGVTWRRLAAGFLASCYGSEFGERLGPTQLGVGVSRGVEIFAATVRLALESNPRWVVVKVDFRNAFNEVSRLAFLRFCAAHFPQLLLFLLAAYGAPAYITALGPDGWVRFL